MLVLDRFMMVSGKDEETTPLWGCDPLRVDEERPKSKFGGHGRAFGNTSEQNTRQCPQAERFLSQFSKQAGDSTAGGETVCADGKKHWTSLRGLNQCGGLSCADAQGLFGSRIRTDPNEHSRKQSGRIGEQLLVATPVKQELTS